MLVVASSRGAAGDTYLSRSECPLTRMLRSNGPGPGSVSRPARHHPLDGLPGGLRDHIEAPVVVQHADAVQTLTGG